MLINTTLSSIRTLQQNGELTQALALCQDVVAQHPKHPAGLALLGVLHCQQQNIQQGRACLQALPKDTSHFETSVLADIAAIHLLLKEPTQALDFLNLALNQQADFYLAQARRGLVLMQLGQFTEALADLQTALPHCPAPQHAALHINIARCALWVSDHNLALAHVELAQTLGGSHLQPCLWVAVDTYIALNHWEAAEAAIHQALEAGAEELACIKLLALVLAAQDKHDHAKQLLRKALDNHPEDVELLIQLANITKVQGHYGEVVRYLRAAIKLEPDNASLWAQLAHLGKRHFDERGAVAAAEKALALTEHEMGLKRAEALVAIASVNEDSQAELYYQQALGLVPDYVPACLGLGHLLLQWGRVEEAVAYFETVAARHPVAGVGALINARRFPEDETLLAHIERIAYLPSLQGAVSSGLLFDLAAAWEHKKDYAKAFRFVDEANAASRKFLNYSAGQHTRQCLAIRNTFTAGFFSRTQAYGHPSVLPTFVLGMPRSGTTLVEQILGGHPDVFVAGEIGILSGVVHRLNAWERHIGSGLHYPECVRDLTATQAQHFANEILAELRQYAPEARHIVDKLPHNFEHIGLIRLLFPNAPIIHVLREPRDVAVSNYFTDYQAKFGGMGFAYDLADIGMQLRDHQALMRHWDSVCAKPVLTIRYEDVVADTEAAARQILAYLELAWTDAVLAYQNLERAVKTASVWQVRQPIYQTSKEKWRRYAEFLQPLETVLAEPVAVDMETDEDTLPAGHFFTGMTHLQAHETEQAAEIFQDILQKNPRHAAALYMLGVAHFYQGQAQSGLALMQKAITQQPYHASWYQNVAMVCTHLNRLEEAQAALNKAQKLQAMQKLNATDF